MVLTNRYCRLIAAILLAAVLWSGDASRVSAYERPTLCVGYTCTHGYLSCDEDGCYRGMIYESMEALATYLGATMKYIPGTPEENARRLQSGSIDILAMEDSITSQTPPDTLRNPPSGTYAIMLGRGIGYLQISSQNPRLYQQITQSLQAIRRVSPLQNLYLLAKYQQTDNASLVLTEEETEYLKKHPVIQAMASPGQAPYSWFRGNVHEGVIADIMHLVAADLGITIEIQPNYDQSQMMAELASGETTMVTDFYADYNWARLHNADITFPYLTLNYVAVLRKDQNPPQQPIIACPRDHFYSHNYIEAMYPTAQLRYYDTVEECMDAVNRHLADLTFVKSITAQSDIYQGNYYNLYTNGNVVFSHDVSMAVSNHADPMLIRILNKEIAHLNQQQIASIINQQVYAVQSKDTIQALIYRNPVNALLFSVSLLTAVILTLLYLLHMRRKHEEELYRETHYIKEIDMYNIRWFLQALPEKLVEHQTMRRQGKLFLMIISARHIAFMQEMYSRSAFYAALRNLISDIRQNNDWLLTDAISSDLFNLIILCRLPEGFTMEQAAKKIAENASSCDINGTPTVMRYYIGLCAIPPRGDVSAEELLDCTMLAHSKSVADNKELTSYNPALHDAILYQNKMENLMEKALANHEFQIYLQPKYDIHKQTICGAESLVRWQSPELGFLTPGRFIDLFEHNGFIVQLDYYMLETICRYQRDRLDRGLATVPISVNQSGLHMMEETYLQHMSDIARCYHLPPGLIDLELTETAFIDFKTHEARQDAASIIHALRRLGFALSMDDFCTGYSSIAMLQNLPMDSMKIDRSMLLAAEKSPRSLTILRQVIGLGHSLGMKVLTEGIENRSQELLLLSAGCQFGQGFFFAKPMPITDFADFLSAHPIEPDSPHDNKAK